jgi:hypothetical protein
MIALLLLLLLLVEPAAASERWVLWYTSRDFAVRGIDNMTLSLHNDEDTCKAAAQVYAQKFYAGWGTYTGSGLGTKSELSESTVAPGFQFKVGTSIYQILCWPAGVTPR